MGASGHRDQLSPFGYHIAVTDVASGGVNEGGDGLVGHCCGCLCHGSGRCRGGDMAHHCHVGCVAWQAMWGPTHRLAHGGCS